MDSERFYQGIMGPPNQGCYNGQAGCGPISGTRLFRTTIHQSSSGYTWIEHQDFLDTFSSRIFTPAQRNGRHPKGSVQDWCYGRVFDYFQYNSRGHSRGDGNGQASDSLLSWPASCDPGLPQSSHGPYPTKRSHPTHVRLLIPL